ncbi:MAG TPA: TauD/TfdA family dioxygenase [Sphingobium sp.]|uniref:TauD/TfdA dioxygenase family protein n=1 Tax=Sphingobium sp. TaxID=1912891 RepID=UPI002ED6BAEA
MPTQIEARFAHESIRPRIASRVLNSKEELLSGRYAPEIRALLEERGVLVFPEIHFTDEEQAAFTRTLGTLAKERDGEDVFLVTLDDKKNKTGSEYLKGSLYWHIDGTMNPVPILASLLASKKLATWGGNTGFSNTYAAWNDLPEDRKVELEGLRVLHAAWASLFYYDPEPALEKLKFMRMAGEQELPLVWKHRSGRKSLVLGATAQHVVGVDAGRSAEILVGLREWATRDDFTYSHEWKVGDLVMWDNTGTMHRAEPYDPACARMLHRTKLQGEEPFV